jgi:glycosyltransferase involved in cell wall biosynthesis
MRTTLVISTLRTGGAERVLSIMANYWAERGWPITLITLADDAQAPFYPLDARIRRVGLGLMAESSGLLHGLINNGRRVAALRRALCAAGPEIVLSFMDRTNVMTLLAMRGTNTPVVVSERTVPGLLPIGRFWGALRERTYPHAAAVVFQSLCAARALYPVLPGNMRVIPNPVLPPPEAGNREQGTGNSNNPAPDPQHSTSIQRPALVAMGRFTEEKRFGLLLEAFAQVGDDFPAWSLRIFGEGPLREKLLALRSRLGLDDRVHLPGRVKDSYDVLRQADIFVLASRVEGFPNALCEAMACGVPVISADCPCGPREIVRSGVDGLLVASGDVGAMAAAMRRLMSDAAERRRLGARAVEITERFSLKEIMSKWEALFEYILRKSV